MSLLSIFKSKNGQLTEDELKLAKNIDFDIKRFNLFSLCVPCALCGEFKTSDKTQTNFLKQTKPPSLRGATATWQSPKYPVILVKIHSYLSRQHFEIASVVPPSQ